MKDIFRKKAVDSYKELFSADVQITRLSVSSMLLIPIFIIGLILTGIWFFWGNITTTVNITGVVYPAGGIRYITAPEEGIISDINIEIGEKLKVGDITAVIPNEAVLKQIDDAAENEALAEKLRQDYYASSIITSKYNGTVISAASEGTYIEKGGIIAAVAAEHEDNNQRQIFALMPTDLKNNISKDCSVQVSPNYAPREKFGYINGYVKDIDDIIITKRDALKELDIYNIPSLLDEDKTYAAVYINLMPDPDAESGLSWSDSGSGDIDVGPGTVCSNSIIISSQSPYKWLLGGGDK